jgi:hypothetical protein
LDLSDDFTHLSTHLYKRGALEIEVCPYYFEKVAKFFGSFSAYLKEVLLDGGSVYISVFTQPYLRVEENTDVIAMFNEMVESLSNSNDEVLLRLFYHHLAEYGTALEDHQTIVWKLPIGTKHNQDEALIREVSRFPGSSPTFGCACYAAYPGSMFSLSRHDYGHDYAGLHVKVLEEIERRGGSSKILESGEIKLNDLVFP